MYVGQDSLRLRCAMNTVNVEVPMPQKDYELLARAAEERDQSAAELLQHLATEFLEMLQVREANYRAVEEARTHFPGRYVAIRDGQILAHADAATTLLQTVQDKYKLSGVEVLIVKADPPDLRIRHPQLVIA